MGDVLIINALRSASLCSENSGLQDQQPSDLDTHPDTPNSGFELTTSPAASAEGQPRHNYRTTILLGYYESALSQLDWLSEKPLFFPLRTTPHPQQHLHHGSSQRPHRLRPRRQLHARPLPPRVERLQVPTLPSRQCHLHRPLRPRHGHPHLSRNPMADLVLHDLHDPRLPV